MESKPWPLRFLARFYDSSHVRLFILDHFSNWKKTPHINEQCSVEWLLVLYWILEHFLKIDWCGYFLKRGLQVKPFLNLVTVGNRVEHGKDIELPSSHLFLTKPLGNVWGVIFTVNSWYRRSSNKALTFFQHGTTRKLCGVGQKATDGLLMDLY